MKRIALIVALCLVSTSVGAQQWVNGYTRSNGTYVPGYYRSTPDGNPYNNYSTQGNINPYTGAVGTKSPYGSDYGSGNYGSGLLYGSPGNDPTSLGGGGTGCSGIFC